MGYPKACRRFSLTAVFLAIFFTGCAGRPLSEREIVRAVFFTGAGTGYQATLLVQDQQSEQPDGVLTVNGAGSTAAQALDNAVRTLDGEAFYGAMDLVGLPPGTDYAALQQFVGLIGKTAQPSPEVSLLLLDRRMALEVPDKAGELYQQMRQWEKKYGVSCGLERAASQQGAAALPIWQEGGFGFAVLTENGALTYTQPVSAQLAAVLCGQSERLDLTFGGGKYTCQAQASLRCRAVPDRLEVTLQLSDARLSVLAPDLPAGEETLRTLLSAELHTVFEGLSDDFASTGTDPCRFQFWVENLLGAGAPALPVTLNVTFG